MYIYFGRKLHRGCYGAQKYEKIIFPISNREKYVCSAGVNNIFPFLNIDIPSFTCIDTKRLRCPDWKENVYYSIEADSPTDQIEEDSPTDQIEEKYVSFSSVLLE